MAKFCWTSVAVLVLITHQLAAGAEIRKRQVDQREDLEDKYGEFSRPGWERPNQFPGQGFSQFGQGQVGQNGQLGQFPQNGQFGQNGRFPQNGQFGQIGTFPQNGPFDQIDQTNGQGQGQQQQQSQIQTDTTLMQRRTQCLRSCLTTSEYNPVCGTDNVTYFNPGRLNCASRCTPGITERSQGPCPAATTAAPAVPAPQG